MVDDEKPKNQSGQRLTNEAKRIRKEFIAKLSDLMTAGFGLVAALAWNQLIKDFIDQYVQSYFGSISGLISELIYAVFITLLAVLVTYNLSKLSRQ